MKHTGFKLKSEYRSLHVGSEFGEQITSGCLFTRLLSVSTPLMTVVCGQAGKTKVKSETVS